MLYRVILTKKYKKAFKKIRHDLRLVRELEMVTHLLILDENLPPKYRDHRLAGDLKDFRELHIRPDILLIYQKRQDLLILTLSNLGSHSELF